MSTTRAAPAKRELSKKEMKALAEALPQKYRDFLDADRAHHHRGRDGKSSSRSRRTTSATSSSRTSGSGARSTPWASAPTTARSTRAASSRRSSSSGDLHNDRAKVFVLQGPPDAVVPIDCQDIYVPLQIWYYERMEVLKTKLYLIFYQPYGTGALQDVASDRRPRRHSRRRRLLVRAWPWAPGRSTSRAASSGARCEQALQYSSAALGVGRLLARGFEQALRAAHGRDRGRRADPLDDDRSPRRLGGARRAEAGPIPRGPRQQDRHGPLAPRPEGGAEGPGARRGDLLQRGRHRRGRQGRPADRQLQVPLRHPDRGDRRREDPADRAALPLSRRLQAHPQGLRRQPERRGAHRRGPDRPGAAGRAAAPDRRGPRGRQGGHRPDQGRRPAALGDLAPADRQGDRHRPPAFRDEGRRERQDRRLLPERREDHDAHEGALRRRPEPRAAAPQADDPRRGVRADRAARSARTSTSSTRAARRSRSGS